MIFLNTQLNFTLHLHYTETSLYWVKTVKWQTLNELRELAVTAIRHEVKYNKLR